MNNIKWQKKNQIDLAEIKFLKSMEKFAAEKLVEKKENDAEVFGMLITYTKATNHGKTTNTKHF